MRAPELKLEMCWKNDAALVAKSKMIFLRSACLDHRTWFVLMIDRFFRIEPRLRSHDAAERRAGKCTGHDRSPDIVWRPPPVWIGDVGPVGKSIEDWAPPGEGQTRG